MSRNLVTKLDFTLSYGENLGSISPGLGLVLGCDRQTNGQNYDSYYAHVKGIFVSKEGLIVCGEVYDTLCSVCLPMILLYPEVT